MSTNQNSSLTVCNVQPEDKVRYIGCSDAQMAYNGGADDPRPILNEGEVYIVESVKVCSWHTLFKLVNREGWFPSVCFYLIK